MRTQQQQRMRVHRLWVGWLLLLGLLFGAGAHADEPRFDLAVLVDPTGTLSIDEVAAPTAQARFRPLLGGLSKGYTNNVHWLRLRLHAAPGTPGSYMLDVQPPYLDDLRWYVPRADGQGGFTELRTGDRLPLGSRAVASRGFVFPLELTPALPITAYLRLSTGSSSVVVPRLYTEEAFDSNRAREYALIGLYFGVLLAILAQTLIKGLWRHDSLHRAFLCYLVVVGISHVAQAGWAAEWMLPNHPALTDAWVTVGVNAIYIAMARFMMVMLAVERRSTPRLWTLMCLHIGLCVVLLPAGVLGLNVYTAPVLAALNLVLIAGTLWRALEQMQQRQPGSRAMLWVVVSVLITCLVVLLPLMGLLPIDVLAHLGPFFPVLVVAVAMQFALRDRTREYEVARQAAEQQAALERHAREVQGRFVATLSHEIRAPLSLIALANSSLKRMVPAEASAEATRIARIDHGVREVNDLVTRFLATERLQTDPLNPMLSTVDLAALVGDVVQRCTAPKRVACHLALVRVRVDPDLVFLAVSNLVHNAIRYAPQGSIRVSVRSEAGEAVLEVIDRGPGVPASMRPRMFGRFARPDDPAHPPGLGMGLNIVQDIAQRHGGSVAYADHPGGGAHFTLRLPLAPGGNGVTSVFRPV